MPSTACQPGTPGSQAGRGQGPGDAVAQHPAVAAEEVHLVARLQGQRIERVAQAQVLEPASALSPTSRGDRGGGLDVPALAVVGRQSTCRLAGGPRDGDAVGLGAEQVQPGLQHVGHRHLGRQRERALDVGQRIVDHAAQLPRGLLPGMQRFGGGSADAVALGIEQVHGGLLGMRHEWWNRRHAGTKVICASNRPNPP
jgi:hypothetical protein